MSVLGTVTVLVDLIRGYISTATWLENIPLRCRTWLWPFSLSSSSFLELLEQTHLCQIVDMQGMREETQIQVFHQPHESPATRTLRVELQRADVEEFQEAGNRHQPTSVQRLYRSRVQHQTLGRHRPHVRWLSERAGFTEVRIIEGNKKRKVDMPRLQEEALESLRYVSCSRIDPLASDFTWMHLIWRKTIASPVCIFFAYD